MTAEKNRDSHSSGLAPQPAERQSCYGSPYMRQRAVIIAIGCVATSCSLFSTGNIGVAACPALRPEASAFDASFSANAQVNAKVRAFAQASKDMAWVSGQIEQKAARACRRIGADIGVPFAAMRAKEGPGGAASGACEPVAARIDATLRQGIRLWVTVTPAQCQANAHAYARCGGVCDVNRDAECSASCRAHANVHASCTPGRVTVRVSQGQHLAGALVNTLNANLPDLIEAQITLGQRLYNDARTVVQVGAKLPKVVGKAGGQALACIAAGADQAAKASVRVRVSIRASATVTSRVGG